MGSLNSRQLKELGKGLSYRMIAILTLITVILPAHAYAASSECRGGASGTGVFSGVDTTCLAGVEQLIVNITNLAFTAVGVVSVIFIIIGGIQLATSTGNPSGTKKAKSTITYAIAGLVLAISAAAIGNFVLSALG